MSIDAARVPFATREATDHADRIAALRERMTERGLAAAAVASPENVYYLTGLDHLGYFAFTLLIVPERGDPVIVTRDMERATVLAQIPHCRHVTFGAYGPSLPSAARGCAANSRLPTWLAWRRHWDWRRW